MKNLNIMRVHWKIRFLRGGFTKNQYIEEDFLKRRALAVCRFKWGCLVKKRQLVFLRGGGGWGWNPNARYDYHAKLDHFDLLLLYFIIWIFCHRRARKIRCTVVSCAYRVPEVVSRRMKYCVPKIFISSYLCPRCKFRSSTVTDKQ